MSSNKKKDNRAGVCSALGKVGFFIMLSGLVLFTSLPSHTSDKKVVLLPLAVYADRPLDHIRKGAASMLASRLAGGGVTVIGQERIESYAPGEGERGITSEKRAEELVKELHAEYGIFGSITAIGEGYSLDLALVEVGTKEMPLITRVSKTATADQFIPVFSEVADQLRTVIQGKEPSPGKAPKPSVSPKESPAKALFSKWEQERAQIPGEKGNIYFKPTSEFRPFKPSGTIPLNMEVMSFDMGDLDGDGNVELVIVGRKKMVVYRQEQKSFVLLDTRNASWGEEFLKVSVGDIDKNGMAEIYVVSLYGTRARSTVFERAGEFTRLAGMIGHLRTVKDPLETNSLLLFQDSKVNEFFSGPIYRMKYDKNAGLTKSKALPPMKGAQFYTLLSPHPDPDESTEWIGLGEPDLNEKSKLHLWGRGGAALWRGKRNLGGTNNAIRLGNSPRGDLPPRITFNSRLLLTDVDGDGSKEILAVENIPLMEHARDFKVYTKSRLIAYERQDSGFLPRWETGKIDYAVTELQASEQALFLSDHKAQIANIGKKSSLILWFE